MVERHALHLNGDTRCGRGIDAPFEVGFVHRLRFTRDVLAPDNTTLQGVLETGDTAPARGLVFIDGGVAEAWPGLPARLVERLGGGGLNIVGEPVVLPGGEQVKNDPAAYQAVIKAIHDAGICRQSYVVVVGGGAVLDAVGFAASIAHRGVRLVRMPTTTLSQADGGLGVKNGINAFGKKNFLGTFAAPWAVVNDLGLLATLSDGDFRSGFSEAIKVALIKDAAFFDRILADLDGIRARDIDRCGPIIERCAELHLEHIVCGGDPFELTVSRPLDFGHWSAHKLEQMTGFAVSHGEAVAIGVALDVLYSAARTGLPANVAARILDSLRALGFTLHHEALHDVDVLIEGLEEFREHLGGRLTITLLRDVGVPVEVHEIDTAGVRHAIDQLAG